jgi:5-methylcytosine-specific restriction endonuclease McrA
MARVEHDLSPEQWAALLDAWGGRYTLDNVVPACRSCNASKWNLEVTTWLRRHGLDEPRFLVRHRQVSTELLERFAAEP